MSDKRYWSCIIGPVDKDELPWGSDAPLRMAVRDRFVEIFGDEDVCASGWGMDEEEYREIQQVMIKHFHKRIKKEDE